VASPTETRELKTVLFTDVVDSTVVAVSAGDKRWREIVDALEAAVARTAEEQGGTLVKGTGDGALCLFDRPSGAIAAGVDVHRAAHELGLTLRMGIHTGEVERRIDDVSGIAVHVASRIESIAAPGEVLVSSTVRDLTEGGGFTFVDRGERELRGIPGSWHLLAVQTDFEVAPATRKPRGNLPARLSSFVGRSAELIELSALLNDTRLLTITGFGGSGKTRMAIELGSDVAEGYSDGVWLLELAPLGEGSLIATEMLGALGLDTPVGKPHIDSLRQQMAEREALLIVDNCEHMLDDAAEVVRVLLESAPSLRVVATSRERLGIPGEVAWQLPELSLPAEGENDPEGVLGSDAGRLFVTRAAAARPGFEIDQSNAADIAGVCRRLDGLPLALELGAAKAKTMSVRELGDRLDDRFKVLTGDRSGEVHHRTLKAAVEWSYDLLPPEEQALYAQLSVFAGGFTADAAEAVVDDPDCDVLACLDRLVEQSLIYADTALEGTRYRLLETMRQHGTHLLAESGDAAAVHRSHLAWVTAFSREARKGIGGKDAKVWLERVRREHDNVRAALRWALENDPVAGVALATPMAFFWWSYATEETPTSGPTTSYLLEGAEWTKQMLAAAGDDLSPTATARAEHALGGLLLIRLGEFEEATELCSDAKRIFRELDDTRNDGWATFYLGIASFDRVSPLETKALFDEALHLHTDVGDTGGIALDTLLMGLVVSVIDGPSSAVPYMEQFATMAEAARVPFFTAHADDSLAMVRLFTDGATPEVREHLRKAVALFREINNRACLTHCMHTVAMYHAASGDQVRSATCLGAAQGIRNRLSMVAAPYEDRTAFVEELGLADMPDADREDAFERGRSLSYDEACAYVVAGL